MRWDAKYIMTRSSENSHALGSAKSLAWGGCPREMACCIRADGGHGSSDACFHGRSRL